jgi:hypothetical protein
MICPSLAEAVRVQRTFAGAALLKPTNCDNIKISCRSALQSGCDCDFLAAGMLQNGPAKPV